MLSDYKSLMVNTVTAHVYEFSPFAQKVKRNLSITCEIRAQDKHRELHDAQEFLRHYLL